jgi:transcriptional regulator with XRE-family HTH domain
VTVPAEFWTRADVTNALTNRDIGQLFHLLIPAAGISQMRLGTATGFAQGRVSDIMRGKHKVKTVAVFTRIADGLDMPDDARAGLGLITGQPAPAIGTGYPASTSQTISALASLWHGDESRAQELLSAPLAPAAWNAAALAWMLSPADDPTPGHPEGRAVGLADVARVRSSSALLAELDNRFGGAHARRSLVHYLDSHVTGLLAGSYTADVGRELFNAVSEASLLAAWTSYDCGLHGLAQRYYIHALRLARSADDRQLACSIMSAMSHQATYLGHLTEAANLARAAVNGLADQATPALTAQFLAMEARALARAGDSRGCQSALAAAERAFQTTEPGRDPEFIAYFNEAEFSAEAAHCFRDLGQPRQALTHAIAAMPSKDGRYARSDFFVTMVRAHALADQDEPAHACTVAFDALSIGEALTSARCVTYVREFRKRLTRFGDCPDVRHFADQAAGQALWIKAA